MRSSCLTVAVAAALSFVPMGASAQSVDLDLLSPNPGAAGDEVVSTGRALEAGAWRAGVMAHYQGNLSRVNDSPALISDRLLAHVALAYGLTDWLQLGAQLPVVARQSGNGAVGSAGIATPTVGLRASLMRQSAGAAADLTAGVTVGLPIGTSDVFGRNPGVSVLPEVAVGREDGGIRYGASLGAYLREASGVAPATDAFPAQSDVRLGASISTANDEGPRGELNARLAVGLAKPAVGAEIMAGVRVPVWEGGEAFVLAGPGFGPLMGVPTFRILAGLTFGSPAVPQDLDGDGITGKDDQCPNEPEDIDGFEDEDGCPEPDNDNDGVPDTDDACPMVAADTEDGCPIPDRDGDGVPDSDDLCPDEAGPAEKKGCMILDTDKDGLEDHEDRCPTVAGIAELRGCPAKDDDSDGVPNHRDNCPTVAGPADNQGCPAEQKQKVVMAGTELKILDKVFFNTGTARIQARSNELLDQVAAVLLSHPEITKVGVDGHSDSTGSAATNTRLSQQRAEAVVKYLVSKGVDESRLTARGFGPEKPAESNDTAAGRDANRRVEFQILEQADQPAE